jgi:hypothetical protein
MLKMSTPEQIDTINLLPNRLAIAPFSSEEVETIIGGNEYENQLLASNFNWVAAYLCEEVGILEYEVVDWFRSEAKGLDGKSPLDAWKSEDGFWKVFEYAQQYKAQVDEALSGEDLGDGADILRSNMIGKNALDIILKSFEVAGVDISPGEFDPYHTRSRTIHNPNTKNSPIIRWKGNKDMEDFRVTIDEGQRSSNFFIVRHFMEHKDPVILQTGIGRRMKAGEGKDNHTEIDTDIDGRPPSAGEVASFVVPVAHEIRNRTLQLAT